MTTAEGRQERMIGAIPVLLGFTVHALAHANAWGVIPLGAALLWAVWTDRQLAWTKLRVAAAVIAGWFSGAGMLALGAIPPDRPFPPNLWGGAIGVLLALATLMSMSRRIVGALGATLGLVVMSLNVEFDWPLLFSLCVFLAGFLASASALTGTLRIEAGFLVSFALFVVAATMSTMGIYRVVDRFGGTIDRALGRLFMDNLATSRTGIGSDITLSARHRLKPSSTPLIELSEPVRRLRSHTLDVFDGRRWTTSRDTLLNLRVLTSVPHEERFRRTVELLPLAELNGRLPTPGGLWDLQGAAYTIDGGWNVRGEASEPTVKLTGDSRERLPKEPRPRIPRAFAEDLRTELRGLADAIVSEAEPARAQAQALERHFHENFTYSLTTDLVGRDHPLIVLLRERRPASCTYFAGAMAALLQARDWDARVVTGYVGSQPNRWTGRTIVRERDAHAWVEVWLEDEGRFVAFDPTPWRSRDAVMDVGESTSWLTTLYEAISSWIRRMGLAIWHDPWGALGAALLRPWSWPILAMIALVAWRRWVRRPRSTQRPARLASDDPRLGRCYRDFLASLRRAGVSARPAESDDELLERVAREASETSAGRARDFLEKYRRVRYGGDSFDEDLLRAAQF